MDCTEEYNVKSIYYEETNSAVISYYEEPIKLGFKKIDTDTEEKKRTVEDEDYAKYVFYTNLIHTKNTIYDYAKSNNWDFFVTFTFAPEDRQVTQGIRKDRTVDRYNYEKCKKCISKWFNNIKNRICPNIKYLLIAEYHKDKAIHFHGLVSGITEEIGLIKHGENSYHAEKWKYGRNDFSEIKDKQRVTTYITKYVTKEIIALPGKSRFIASQGLNRAEPKKFYTELDFIGLLQEYIKMGFELQHSRSGRNKTKYCYLSAKGA